jgi:hypothetical protein
MENMPWTLGNAGTLPAGCPMDSSQIHIKLRGSTANTNVCIRAMLPSRAARPKLWLRACIDRWRDRTACGEHHGAADRCDRIDRYHAIVNSTPQNIAQ